MDRDAFQATISVLPLTLCVIVPILGSFNTQSHFIQLLAAFGYLNLNSPVPLFWCLVIAGEFWGPIIYVWGWTWGQLAAAYSLVAVPVGMVAAYFGLVPGGQVYAALMAIAAGGLVGVAA